MMVWRICIGLHTTILMCLLCFIEGSRLSMTRMNNANEDTCKVHVIEGSGYTAEMGQVSLNITTPSEVDNTTNIAIHCKEGYLLTIDSNDSSATARCEVKRKSVVVPHVGTIYEYITRNGPSPVTRIEEVMSFSHLSTVHTRCEGDGFKLHVDVEGFLDLKQQSSTANNGHWEPPLPICKLYGCTEQLSAFEHATFHTAPGQYFVPENASKVLTAGIYITYDCVDGYAVGNNKKTRVVLCDGGKLSRAVPCRPERCIIPPKDNTRTVSTKRGTREITKKQWHHGKQVRVTCKKGYKLNITQASDWALSRCSYGQWHPRFAICVPREKKGEGLASEVIGGSCDTDRDCPVARARCYNSTCQCFAGFRVYQGVCEREYLYRIRIQTMSWSDISAFNVELLFTGPHGTTPLLTLHRDINNREAIFKPGEFQDFELHYPYIGKVQYLDLAPKSKHEGSQIDFLTIHIPSKNECTMFQYTVHGVQADRLNRLNGQDCWFREGDFPPYTTQEYRYYNVSWSILNSAATIHSGSSSECAHRCTCIGSIRCHSAVLDPSTSTCYMLTIGAESEHFVSQTNNTMLTRFVWAPISYDCPYYK